MSGGQADEQGKSHFDAWNWAILDTRCWILDKEVFVIQHPETSNQHLGGNPQLAEYLIFIVND